MLRFILLFAAAVMAEDGNPLVQSYIDANWEIAKSNFESEAKANLNSSGCNGAAVTKDYKSLTDEIDAFLLGIVGFVKEANTSGMTLNISGIQHYVKTFKTQFIGLFPEKVCSLQTHLDEATLTKIDNLFTLTDAKLAAIVPAGIRQPAPAYHATKTEKRFSLLGRSLNEEEARSVRLVLGRLRVF